MQQEARHHGGVGAEWTSAARCVEVDGVLPFACRMRTSLHRVQGYLISRDPQSTLLRRDPLPGISGTWVSHAYRPSYLSRGAAHSAAVTSCLTLPCCRPHARAPAPSERGPHEARAPRARQPHTSPQKLYAVQRGGVRCVARWGPQVWRPQPPARAPRCSRGATREIHRDTHNPCSCSAMLSCCSRCSLWPDKS